MNKLAWVPLILASISCSVASAQVGYPAAMPNTSYMMPVAAPAPPGMLPPPTSAVPTLPPSTAPVFTAASPDACGGIMMEIPNCATECCEHYGRLLAGGGVYIVKPYFDNNPAISFHYQGTGPGARHDIRHHMVAAPQGWLGWMNDDGLGARARFFYLRAGTSQNFAFPLNTIYNTNGSILTVLSANPAGAAIISNNPTEFAVTSKLEMQVGDYEILQELDYCNWNFLVSGGVSHANIIQQYNAYALNTFGISERPLTSDVQFVGVGPTVAIEFHRPLCNSCIGLYGSSRSRVLFGTNRQTVVGGEELRGNVTSAQDAVVAVQDLEFGAEINYEVGAARFFSQFALIGQEYFGLGNPSRSSRGAPPTTIPNFGVEDNSNLGLFGLSIRAGVNY